MTILLFGNPDLSCDAVPVQIFARLQKYFPDYDFRVTDPNELDLPQTDEELVIIDTVEGLTETRFIGLDEIARMKARVTAHDFDLASYLLLARKMNKDLSVRIIGIPMGLHSGQAFEAVRPLLEELG